MLFGNMTSTADVPTAIIDICRDDSGSYYMGGTWQDSFWYGSILVDPSSPGTDYNMFQSALSDTQTAVAGHITYTTGAALACGFASGSTYLWCLPFCAGSLSPLQCAGDCWDDYMDDLNNCAELETSRILQAWVEGDSVIDWNLFLYGGC